MAPNQDPTVFDAASNTIVLAFDLLDEQIAALPRELEKTLQSPPVIAAIESTLMKYAIAKRATGTTRISDAEAQKLATTLLTNVSAPFSQGMLDQVKKTAEYKKLEQSLKDLEKSLKQSPVGVWIDRHAGILYVIGAGLAIGGAAALYITKTGGPIVQFPINQLTGKSVQMFKVGKFSLSGQVLAFQPETRTVGAALTGKEQLERLTISVQLGVVASGKDVKEVNGQLVFQTKDINLGLTGTAKPQQDTVNLGLRLEVKSTGLPGPLSVAVGVGLKNGNATQGSLNAGMKTKYGDFGLTGSQGKSDLTGGDETKVLGTWSWSF